jgi:hypothetical protein
MVKLQQLKDGLKGKKNIISSNRHVTLIIHDLS